MTTLFIKKRVTLFSNNPINKLNHGFTLIELAIGIAVIGLIIGTAAQLMTKLSNNNAATQQENTEFSQEIDHAIQGFILANNRLPCPDISTPPDGNENCEQAGGVKIDVGLLPLKTLDIFPRKNFAWMRDIAYGVSRRTEVDDHDLSLSNNRYKQTISNHNIKCDNETVVARCDVAKEDASIANDTVLQYSTNAPDLNILDFCMELELADNEAENSNILHTKGPLNETINIAYAYALAGSSKSRVSGAGYLESLAELITNKNMRAQLTNTVNSTHDDYRRLTSFSSLYENLHCPEKLSGAEATYYNAYANVSNEYLSRINLAAMKIHLSNASSNVDSAEQDVVFGAITIAVATAELAIGVAEAATANPAAVPHIVSAGIQLANAIANEVIAVNNRDSVIDWHDNTVVPATSDFRQRLINSGNSLAQSRRIAQKTQIRGGL